MSLKITLPVNIINAQNHDALVNIRLHNRALRPFPSLSSLAALVVQCCQSELIYPRHRQAIYYIILKIV